MEMSHLNSLAEVGVGVNMAFSLLAGVRDGFRNLFLRKVASKIGNVTILLSEAGASEGLRRVVEKTEVASRYHDAVSTAINKITQAIAVLMVFAFVYFLNEAANNPAKIIAPYWGPTVSVLVFLPIIISASLHLAAYAVVRGWLRFVLRRYENYARVKEEICNAEVQPTPPGQDTPTARQGE